MSKKTDNQKIKPLQGPNATKIFSGQVESMPFKKLYGESAELFAGIIRKNTNSKQSYILADFGCHKGELLEVLRKKLPDYQLHLIGIDKTSGVHKNKFLGDRMIADLTKVPIRDKNVDVAICRYALHWNTYARQKIILEEMQRITKKIAIIQHVGPDNTETQSWRKSITGLLSGTISKLERRNYFWSSGKEIEKLLIDLKIPFKKVQKRRVDKLSEVLIKKFNLNKRESKIVKSSLGNYDYIIQTTWLLNMRA